ncbi:CinA family protein [Ornithinimicrobium avium]|uniref:Nicotinamide-nucleotide amidohydrolase family protein n=1 Tax=Ornithinimicrobium avium TaxID=2283195 RepID=A0A345NID0_9MICO|nr:nicotinamide-nucleotide amidohydrolase family protein [Ornithinimicrobium avium]AXH94788.1 nicotinamide-nucleotide amidohydrolase family protein [Ornithinimicrobium avium]
MTTTAARVLGLLGATRDTLAVAESLTGGLVAAALTDVAGSSEVLLGGVVAYSPQVKISVLGVPAAVVAERGVVSRECALAMADGARRQLGADWAVATTGVAGPGPSDGHPAGTVHLAVVGESRRAHRVLNLHGDRQAVRTATVTAVLALLEETVLDARSGPGGTVDISSHDGDGRAEEG